MSVTGLGWIVVPAVALLLGAAAELFARWWVRHRSPYYVFPPGWRLLLHPDRAVFPQLEPSIRFEVNQDGERGDEVPRPQPDQTLYRVLVAGGSQPEGYFLDQHTCWPGALPALLETPDNLRELGASRVHVGSIARSGVGSEALSLILERVLPRYPRLQAIIILVGASDVLRWMEQGAPPAPPTASTTSDVFMSHPEKTFAWRPKRLAVVELLLRWRQRLLPPVEVRERAGSWIGKARAMRANAKVIRTAMPDAEPMLSHFERCLGEAIRLAKAHADRVLVVRQPWFDRDLTPEEAAQMWHGGVGQAWKEEVTVYYSHEILARLMALLDERASRVARELGVSQLDLRPAVPASLETYYDFFHLTPAGARAAAPAVATALVHQRVPSADGSEALTRSA